MVLDINNSFQQILYASDESRLQGGAPRDVVFPESVDDVVAFLSEGFLTRTSLTVSGSRTGVVGGAVPLEGSRILSLEKMRGFLAFNPEHKSIKVLSGTTLMEIDSFLLENCPQLVFPVNPTEGSASIGGVLSTNASGSRSLKYGSARDWVDKIKVVLANGEILDIRRGASIVQGGKLVLPSTKTAIIIEAADIPKPETKHSLGYSFHEGMDALDLFVGAEGTLGIICEVEIKLTSRPKIVEQSIFIFNSWKSVDSFLSFLVSCKEYQHILSLEYFDPHSVHFGLKRSPEVSTVFSKKDGILASHFVVAEWGLDDRDFDISRFLCKVEECGLIKSEDCFFSTDSGRDAAIRSFRVGVPEAINSLIAERKKANTNLHKVATDMAVPLNALNEMMELYISNLGDKGLEFAIFGHLGQGNLHVNILPRNYDELRRGLDLYESFARDAVRLGGAISAEHGIGRLKKGLLKIQYCDNVVAQMRKIKKIIDPHGMLNPGVIFDL